MLDAAFQHFRTTANVGDRACCPGDYLEFGTTLKTDFGADLPACRLAVFGGGQVWNQSLDALIYHSEKARKKVLWAVGIDATTAGSLPFEIARAQAALISSRNWGVPGCDYVPCASALSPLFDAPPPPAHEVVLFTHARKSAGLLRPDGIPEMTNHGVTMAQAIAHIASGAVVVTNSYHGTYWAMCLGRRVLCLPFGQKFHGFRDTPAMADPADWTAALATARRHDGLLDEARRLNRAFHEKVLSL
ncbi:MAG: hypothetical protein R3D85_06090 [Paracoccaceae bacterium]